MILKISPNATTNFYILIPSDCDVCITSYNKIERGFQTMRVRVEVAKAGFVTDGLPRLFLKDTGLQT